MSRTTEDEKPPILNYRSPGKNPSDPGGGCAESLALLIAGASIGFLLFTAIARIVDNARALLPWMLMGLIPAIVACVFRKSRMFGIGMLIVLGFLCLCVGVCRNSF